MGIVRSYQNGTHRRRLEKLQPYLEHFQFPDRYITAEDNLRSTAKEKNKRKKQKKIAPPTKQFFFIKLIIQRPKQLIKLSFQFLLYILKLFLSLFLSPFLLSHLRFCIISTFIYRNSFLLFIRIT